MSHGKFKTPPWELECSPFPGSANSSFSRQIVNGYFVHFFAPPHLPRVPKNVVFVIDRSSSMSGMKMQQVVGVGGGGGEGD